MLYRSRIQTCIQGDIQEVVPDVEGLLHVFFLKILSENCTNSVLTALRCTCAFTMVILKRLHVTLLRFRYGSPACPRNYCVLCAELPQQCGGVFNLEAFPAAVQDFGVLSNYLCQVRLYLCMAISRVTIPLLLCLSVSFVSWLPPFQSHPQQHAKVGRFCRNRHVADVLFVDILHMILDLPLICATIEFHNTLTRKFFNLTYFPTELIIALSL